MLGHDAHVTIVGAGLGGCWLAYELSRLGVRSTVIDSASGPGCGASGNPAGIVKPAVTRSRTASEAFHEAALGHLLSRLGEDGLARAARWHPCGVLQLTERRWQERPDLAVLDGLGASRRAGVDLGGTEPGEPATASLWFEGAGWLDPASLCRALIERAAPTTRFDTRLASVSRLGADDGDAWRLSFDDGDTLDCETLILASGPAIASTPWTASLPVTPTRGQLSRFATRAALRTVVSGRGWVIPDGDTLVTGATYARDDEDTAPRDMDDDANRASLRALLPGESPDALLLESRAGIRATTPDRLPIVGPMPDLAAVRERYADPRGDLREVHGESPESPEPVAGLHVLGGFSSRGIVTAPWSARLLAAWLADDGARALEDTTPLIGPARFLIRELRRA